MWKGNKNNDPPNLVEEPIERSEKLKTDNESVSSFNATDVGNRAEQLRRDTDTQKNFTISLLDIDEAILLQLEQLQLQVEDVGKQVKVPIFYGSPERWVSAQRDGYLRDKQGKILLPAMILKRSNSEADTSLQFFNRYLNTPVMKLYSQKNQYTQFSTLMGQNVPINEVYNIVVPSYMVLTYHFIIWTAYVEQMNKLVETIQFNTQDYWGSKKGFRFRTKVNSYGHTVEIQANEDRIVKTEFDLVTHGYILPDSMTKLESHMMTTKKMLTPKKMILGVEVVSTDYDLAKFNKNREKWRNPTYPNLPLQPSVPSAPVSNKNIGENLRTITQIVTIIQTNPSPFHLPAPPTSDSPGEEGWLSYDNDYYYVYTLGKWKRVPIALFNTSTEF